MAHNYKKVANIVSEVDTKTASIEKFIGGFFFLILLLLATIIANKFDDIIVDCASYLFIFSALIIFHAFFLSYYKQIVEEIVKEIKGMQKEDKISESEVVYFNEIYELTGFGYNKNHVFLMLFLMLVNGVITTSFLAKNQYIEAGATFITILAILLTITIQSYTLIIAKYTEILDRIENEESQKKKENEAFVKLETLEGEISEIKSLLNTLIVQGHKPSLKEKLASRICKQNK